MAELKQGRERVKFGDVVRLVTERCDPAAVGIDRVVGLEHLDPGDLRIRRWADASGGTTFTNRFRSGQVLFGKRRAYQRKVALADFDGVCSGDIYILESGAPTRLLPELLPFLCQTDAFFEHAIGTSAGSLSPRTNWTALANFDVSLPEIEEQRRIASQLRAIEQAIDCQIGLLAVTRQLKRSVLANVVLGNADFARLKIADVAKVVRGSTPRPAGDPRYFNGSDAPWITVGEITRDESALLRATETYLTKEGASRSRLLMRGTVVLSNSGFSLGVPKILDIDGCANDGVAAFLELSAKVVPMFLYYCLLGLTDYFRNVVAAGGDQPNLNTARIGDVEIPCPPVHEQRRLAEIMEAIDGRLQGVRERISYLRSELKRLSLARLGGGDGL